MRMKIAIVHPQFLAGGGSEARPLWLAESLKREFQIDLITMGAFNLESLNSTYGTSLKPGEINIISIPVFCFFRNRFDAIRAFRLHRFCRKHASDYAAMISTYNVMDFGKRGIQFIADFSFYDELRDRFFRNSYRTQRVLYRKSVLRSIYTSFASWLLGTRSMNWLNNMTVANSQWSRDIYAKVFHKDSLVIYPPVPIQPRNIPWDEKKDAFLVLGRISPEKEIDSVISILKSVRKCGYDIKLRLCGRASDDRYGNYIKRLAAENASWISMEGLVSGERKKQILSSCRYGISGCKFESFGIATAEMIKSGAIVWVPNDGGQKEIISHTQLIYQSKSDATDKIIQVLSNKTLQNKLAAHLSLQSKLFTLEDFTIAARQVIINLIISSSSNNSKLTRSLS